MLVVEVGVIGISILLPEKKGAKFVLAVECSRQMEFDEGREEVQDRKKIL